ncbi:MAG TPA: hypothetical protein VH351_19680 [Bryobacteraceae bacterium]|jgi:hypothetical protein|nr:hypothetical protein [Bryobacteraceae bacterium]
MGPIATSGIVLASTFAAAVCGVLLRTVLPPNHFNDEAKDAIKLATGLVGSMVALILGLLVWSSKSFFDTQSAEMTKISAQAVMLDGVLSHYGPEANGARDRLRAALRGLLDQTWSHNGESSSRDPTLTGQDDLYEAVERLSSQNESQRSLRASGISMLYELGQTRWLIYEQNAAGLPRPLLFVLVCWLALLFLSFGLFAPTNGTVAASLFLSALAVSGAVLMALEMYSPYHGLIQVSSQPLRVAIAHLGK